MNRTSLFIAAGGLFIAIAAGCQAIAGLQDRSADPLPTNPCALPASSVGNGRVRLVNVANVGSGLTTPGDPLNYTDFCIKPSSSSDWGRPIFRDGGNDALCLGTSTQPGGLEYGEATVSFAVPVGKIDVKAIPSGKTCSVAGTSEVDGVTVGDSTQGSGVVTLMRWGGGSSAGSGAEGMTALTEDVTSALKPGTAYVRPVNALSGNKAITFGTATGTSLPATITNVFIPSIPPGGVPTQAQSTSVAKVDAQGYLSLLNAGFSYAAGYAGESTNAAQALYPSAQDTSIGTMFVIGDPTDTQNAHPVRGLFCLDDAALTLGDGGASGNPQTNVPASDVSLFEQCTFTSLPSLLVDMVNTSFYGANAPAQEDRLLVVPGAIAARTSDLMCVVETADSSTRNAILQAVNGATPVRFPYSYVTTPEATEATQPTDPKYPVPTPPTPPCGGSVSSTVVQNAINCVEQNCSTVTAPGDPSTGYLNGTTSCLIQNCTAQLAPLYAQVQATPAEAANDACFACLVAKLTTTNETIAQTQSDCTTQAEPPYAFQGQVPSMILSHYPIVTGSTQTYIFPSTDFRRAILKAQIQLEDQKVDFFCTQLISPLIDTDIPYTGAFGHDSTDGGSENGFEDEQDLEANLAVAWIKQQATTDGVAAIVAGDLHADNVSTGGDGGLIDLSPEVVTTFSSALTSADPKNYVHVCDYCPAPQNPYNAGTPPYELIHSFLIGFPANATQSETLWGNDNTQVPLKAGGTGPLFEYYAHNYVILRP